METKTRSVKLVTLLLFVALVFTAVWVCAPVAHAEGAGVASVGGVEYTTLQAAIDAAADGDTVTLLADISGEAEATAGKDQYLIADKSLTIDGNGFTVTSDSKRVFRIENGTGAMLNITFQNIRIVATNDVADNSRCINTYSDNIALTITDSELISESTGANSQPLSIGGSATGNTVLASLRNVKIQAGANENGYAIISFVPVELSIENAEIAGYTALYLKDGADGSCISITSSNITTFNQVTGESNGFAALVVESDNANIVVEDTVLALSSKDAENATQFLVSLQEYYYDTGIFAENCTVTMRGITVTGAVEGKLINNVDASNTVSIESGSFDVVDAKNYMADGTIFVETANGVVVGFEGDPIVENAKADAVATVCGNYYATLQAAIDAAADGDTVTLLADISGEAEATAGKDQYLIADKSLTIDGNGFTVTSDSKRVFRIENSTGAMLNITFQNIRIVATNDVADNSRCINTYSDNIALTITDSELISESTGANSQPLSIGGSATGNTVLASLRNVKIQAGANENGYAIISFVPVDLSIENAEIAGYTALYLKDGADGSCISIASSNITTFNQVTGETNGFAALVVESDNANIVVEDTVLALSSKDAENATQFLVSLQEYYYDTGIFAENCTVTMRGITVTGAVEGKLINNVDASNTVSIESGSFNVVDAKNYMADGTIFVETANGLVVGIEGDPIVENAKADAVATVCGNYYATLQAAINAAADGDTVTLLADISGEAEATAGKDQYLIADKSLTIDGNGFTVTSDSKRVFRIENSTEDRLNITFVGIRIVATNDALDNSRCINTYSDNINLFIEDSALISESTGANSQPLSFGGSATGNTVRATLNRVSIMAGANANGYAIISFVPVDLTITESAIGGWSAVYLRETAGNSMVSISDSTVISRNTSVGATNAFGAIVVNASDVTVGIANTYFALESTDPVNAPQMLICLQDQSINTFVTMREVTVTGAVEGYLIQDEGADNTVSIESGSFDVPAPEESLSDNAFTFVDETGTAQIGTDLGMIESMAGVQIGEKTFFATVAAALIQAKDGDVLVLKQSASIDAPIVMAEGDITIDLNGCELYLAAHEMTMYAVRRNTPLYAVVVGAGTTLTLTGEGAISVDGNGYLVDGGALIVEDGVELCGTGGALFTVDSGTLTVNGGRFYVSDGEIIVADPAATVTVTGGSFSEEIDASFLPAGYVQMLDPRYGEVLVLTEAEADMYFDQNFRQPVAEMLEESMAERLLSNHYDANATSALDQILADGLDAVANATTIAELQQILTAVDRMAAQILNVEDKAVAEREAVLEMLNYMSGVDISLMEVPATLVQAWDTAFENALTRAEMLEIAALAAVDIDLLVLDFAIEDATTEAERYAEALGFDGTEQAIADAIANIANATSKREAAKALRVAKAAVDAELAAYKQAAITGLAGANQANAPYVNTAMIAAIQVAPNKAVVDQAATTAANEIAEIKIEKKALETLNTRVQAAAQNAADAVAEAATAALKMDDLLASVNAKIAEAKAAIDAANAATDASIAEVKALVEDAKAKALAAETAANAAKSAAEAAKAQVETLAGKITDLETALGTLETEVENTASKATETASKADAAKGEATAALNAANAAKTAVEEAKAAALAAKAASEDANTTADALKALVETAEAKAAAAETAAKAAKEAVENANETSAAEAEQAEKETITFLTVVAGFEVLVIVVCVVGMMLMLSRKKSGEKDPTTPAAVPVTEKAPASGAPVEDAPVAVVVEKVEIEELPEDDSNEDDSDEDDSNEDDSDEDGSDEDDSDEAADPFATLQGKKSKSFAERLAEADPQMVANYETIRDAMLSYKRVSLRISQKCASFRVGRALVAKILLRGKSVNCYLALDPTAYPTTVYFQKDMREKKAYAEVPFLVRVRSARAAKNAVRLVDELASKNQLVKK